MISLDDKHKCAVIGDPNVGKKTLIQQYLGNNTQVSSIEYKEVSVFILVFSIDNYESFNNIKVRWLPIIGQEIKYLIQNLNPIFVIVGTKYDLRDTRQVSPEEIVKLKQYCNYSFYSECCALDKGQVNGLFQHIRDALRNSNESRERIRLAILNSSKQPVSNESKQDKSHQTINNSTSTDTLSKSVLSDKAILQHLTLGTVVIHPLILENLSTSSYDVTLGENYYRECDYQSGETSIYNPYSKSDVERVWGKPQVAHCAREWLHSQQRGGQALENIAPLDKIIWLKPGETILAHTREFIGGHTSVTTMMKARSSMGRSYIEVCKCADKYKYTHYRE